MHRVLTVKLYPTPAQEVVLLRYLDCGRRVYNHFLEHRIKSWKRRKECATFAKQCSMLTAWRTSDRRMGEVPLRVQRDSLRRLDRAYKAFFARVKAGKAGGFPRFKGRQRWRAMEFLEDGFYASADKRSIRVPKLGPVNCRGLSEFSGSQRALRIIKRASGWYGQIVIDNGIAPPAKRDITTTVGIDVGLTYFAADSTGRTVRAPQFVRRLTAKLRRVHREISRRTKGSANRRKSINRLRRLYEQATDARSNFTHHLSREYIARFDAIAVENLNIAGMVRNRFLAKSIMDAAWGQFIARLSYKAESAGVTFVAVDPRGTSQQCSHCGETVPKDLSERMHRCECGYENDRDVNAAVNILNRGLASLSTASGAGINACGERRRSVKQEGVAARSELHH